MPTLELITEMVEIARRLERGYQITHQTLSARQNIGRAIRHHIEHVNGGHVLFITHEGLVRVTDWPNRVRRSREPVATKGKSGLSDDVLLSQRRDLVGGVAANGM